MKRVVLLTGVSGGIGSATAAAFGRVGWRVAGTDRAPRDDHGLDAYSAADLSDPDAPGRLVGELAGELGRLDCLVHNAASQLCAPLTETTVEQWDEVMAINLRAAFLLVRAAVPHLAASGGSVVHVSSVHATATSSGIAAYAASKGGLLAFTRAAAMDLAPMGIRVNAVLPGAVDTSMLREGVRRQGDDPREGLERLAGRVPLGRIGSPAEIAEAILFLADAERSSYVTGQGWIVDGGATARLSTE